MGSSSNTIYIDNLHAGSTKLVPITINTGLTKVTDDEDANSINMKFDYQYVADKVRKTGTSSENITIPVNFPDRFELTPPEMSSNVMVGEEAYIYMPMVNKGRSSVYNVTAMVRGDMANPGQPQYIGNVTAGSESSAEFNVRFEEAGEHTGEIVVTYEDTNMNPKEAVMAFTINVEEMFEPETEFPFPGGDEGMIEPEIPVDVKEPTDPKDIAMIVVGLIVCAMATYVTIQKAKAKRSIFVDEEL